MADVSRDTDDGLRAARRAAVAQLLADSGIATSQSAISRRAVADTAPLSHAQEVLWLLDRATPGLIAYNSTVAYRLQGSIDTGALQQALDQLVARHESLRTRFESRADGPVQVIDQPVPARLEVIDLGNHPPGEAAAETAERLRERAREPFDLAGEHLLRAVLVRLADDESVLMLLTHHIVSDAWSYGVMLRDLSALYAAARAGVGPALAEPPLQFADVAAWQRGELTGGRLRERLDYWRNQLLPVAADLAMPADYLPVEATFDGGRAQRVLPLALLDALKTLAASEGATLYMLLLAAFQSVLHRWSGQDDIVVGSAIAGRTRSETEAVVGYFSSALPMRTTFTAGESFRALLAQVRNTVVGALEHQDVPIEALIDELRAAGRAGHAPLFQAVLTMQEQQGGHLSIDGVTVTPYEVLAGTTKFDLTLLPAEQADGMALLLWFRADLFSPDTANRLLGHLELMLRAVAADPGATVDDVDLLTEREHAQLSGWNPVAATDVPGVTITQLIERAAARVPDRVAVVAPSSTGELVGIAYRQLESRANQLARELQQAGVAPGDCVGIVLPRSADAILAMLAILKTGAAYMPISADAPARRIAVQIAESRCAVVVADDRTSQTVPTSVTRITLDRNAAVISASPDTPLAVTVAPTAIAYVLFTSGSTGTPKGVAVTHANIVHYVAAARKALDIASDEPRTGDGRHYGLISTLAADLGNTSLFLALSTGATLHVLGDDVATQPARFAEYLRQYPLDVLKITPGHLHALLAGRTNSDRAAVLPRQWLVLGGEALRTDFAATLVASGTCRVLNHYGPTETTVGACTLEATDDTLRAAEAFGARTVPIGRPLPGMRAIVVDRFDNEQPVGMPGELLLAGAGVVPGYLYRPDLTAERFTHWHGERVYRTGDRVRRLPDGTLEFVGRVDDQVKVRGFRVELHEIETVLASHPAVADACVQLRPTTNESEPVLVAHIVPTQATGYAAAHAERLSPATLTAFLAERLPDYMIPNEIALVEKMPRTSNGKLDRPALLALDVDESLGSVAPRTPTETTLATIWGDVFKRDVIGVTDNFLELGGHSLLAIRILGKVTKSFAVRLPLRALFDAPTVAQLAQLIDDAVASRAEAPA